jgi:outer membrane protein assembly factor BamB
MKKSDSMAVWMIGILLAAAATACGGARLQSRFPENDSKQLAGVLEKLRAAPAGAADSRPFLSVVHEGGKGIALVDLQTGKALWDRKDVSVDSTPFVGSGAVLFRSGEQIMALSSGSGKTLWKKSIKNSYLYGFAFDGNKVFVTTGNTDGGSPATGRSGRILALDVESGRSLWSVNAEKMLGCPAASAGMVFVPWDRQAISVFDAEKGSEVFRLIRKDSTVDFVLAGGNGVYYGSARDVQKLTKDSASGTKHEASTFEFEISDMPGNPRIYPDSYVSSTFEGGAQARNRLVWSATGTKESFTLDGDMIYLAFYRYVIGFKASERLPLWVHMSEVQIAASHGVQDGVLLLGTDGSMTYLDGETGTEKELWKADFKANNAYFQVSGFKAPSLEKETPNLHQGLVDMILDVDTQVLPLRKYGMKLLATIPDEKVVMDLVQVMSSADLPKALRDEAARLLRTMKGGVNFLFEALEQHYSFLDETPAPPAGAIASSLAESNEKKAAPLLIKHLKDHETAVEELVELTDAIVALGDAKAYEPLKRFFMMYHADSCMSQHMDVLVNVAEGILKFGGDEGRQIVEDVSKDARSPESLRFQLVELLKTGVGAGGEEKKEETAEKPKKPDKAGGSSAEEEEVEEEEE